METHRIVVAEPTIWGIHGGRTGDADSLFLGGNCIALGWSKMGDLGKLPADREAFKARIAEVFPDAKAGAIPGYAGQLFRFVHEMKPGDTVVYPSRSDRQVHVGRVDGPYRYDPSKEEGYPNVRAVKWLKTVPRTRFSQGALYEIGSAMALFQVKNYADEYRAALEDVPTPPPPVSRGNGSGTSLTDSAGEIASRGTYSSTSYTESEIRVPAGARSGKKGSRVFKPKGK